MTGRRFGYELGAALVVAVIGGLIQCGGTSRSASPVSVRSDASALPEPARVASTAIAADAASDVLGQADVVAEADAPRRPEGFFSQGDAGRPALARAPVESASSDLVVFLHGMCAIPEWECPVVGAASTRAWLLCPPGPALCEGGGRMWLGKTAALVAQVDRHAEVLASRFGMTFTRRTLVGYSLGAPAALRIALAQPGRWQALMILNGSVTPSAQQLRAAGIERLALVAGDRDRTASKLRQHALRLERSGVLARYFSLSATGHFFDAHSAERMVPALQWLTAPTLTP